MAFALDRIKALAPQHPEWQSQEPFKSVLAGDLKGALAGGDKAIVEMVMATHSGMTSEEFADRRTTGSRRRSIRRPDACTRELIYQPMLELLAYLRANGFKTFIVSGGGVEFMRVLAPSRPTAYRPSR